MKQSAFETLRHHKSEVNSRLRHINQSVQLGRPFSTVIPTRNPHLDECFLAHLRERGYIITITQEEAYRVYPGQSAWVPIPLFA